MYLEYLRISRRTLVSIAGVLPEIWSDHVLNTSIVFFFLLSDLICLFPHMFISTFILGFTVSTTCVTIYDSRLLCWTLAAFFQFLILHTFGGIPWTEDQPITRPLSTHKTTQTYDKRTQTSMRWVGIECTIAAFERAKTVHALRQRGHCDRLIT
jgi:hypothetical protein